jgi:hypothetical protein
MYILLDPERNCDLSHDRPGPSTGRTHHDRKNRNCLDYSQNLVVDSGGAQHQ